MATWKPNVALIALLVLSGCAEPPPPQARVRAFIAEIEELAETREYMELVDRIAGDYLDAHGNDKLKAAALLRGFYLKNRTVHLLVKIGEIATPTPDRATARIYVAMASRPFDDGGVPDADLHQVDLELAADGDSYEILQTTWRRANASDLVF